MGSDQWQFRVLRVDRYVPRGATAKFRSCKRHRSSRPQRVELPSVMKHFQMVIFRHESSLPKYSERNACEIICYYDPLRRYYICAGIGGPQCDVLHRALGGQMGRPRDRGSRSGPQAGRPYDLKVKVRGSRIDLWVDYVAVLAAVLFFAITPPSQAGLWCLDDGNIQISNYRVERQRGTRIHCQRNSAILLSSLYDVIKKICDEFQLQVWRTRPTRLTAPGSSSVTSRET